MRPDPAAAASRSALVREVLEDLGGLTRRHVWRYLPDKAPRRYLYDLVRDYPARGGRGLRPSICLAMSRALGAHPEAALVVSVSIELIHNAALIHDDIQDDSELRRGHPSLHRQVGVPLALNAGDMLAWLSLRPLLEHASSLGPRLSLELLEEFERMSIESAEGQAMDIGWRDDNTLEVGLADYLEMVLKKTCYLTTILPMRAGARLGRIPIELEGLTRVGFFLGAAFQIRDDLLNLIGDEARYGKEIDGDILEGKRTLMLIHVLEHTRAGSPADYQHLTTMLGRSRAERASPDFVGWVRGLMKEAGSIEHAREISMELAEAGRREWHRVSAHLPDSREKRFIESLATWIVERG